MQLSLVQTITIWVLPLIFAITLHEVAHGYVASLFGDQTARLSGRLSINPLRHIDPIGTVLLPLIMLMFSNMIFGWAKPVPVDPRNLRNPRRDMAYVALAGPISNILMAIFWGLIAKIGMMQANSSWFSQPIILMGHAGIAINVMLAVLNLIPLPPLDGAKILSSILPPRGAYALSKIEPYSFFILIFLLFSGVLFYVMAPLVLLLNNGIITLFNL